MTRKRPSLIRAPSGRALIAAFLLGLLSTQESGASQNKFDVDIGAFFITAKTQNKSGRAAGPGLYHLGYRRSFPLGIEMGIGYTLCLAKVISGDSVSGLNFGVNYFPFSTAGPVQIATEASTLAYDENWRPFVGFTLNQRIFQSTETTYNGFGLRMGLERTLSLRFQINASASYLLLSAPESSGREADFAAGIGIRF